MLFRQRIRWSVSAFVVLAVFVRSDETPTNGRGPLADRPSKPGKHIDKIKAMGDNTWLNLGRPKADARFGPAQGRSWSRKMAFAPDLRGAFLFGSGVHHGVTMRDGRRRFNDDLFFYDVNAHAWVCAYAGTLVDAKDGLDSSVTLDQATGLNKDKDGSLIPVATSVHAYWTPEYDADRKMFLFMPSTDPFGFISYDKQTQKYVTAPNYSHPGETKYSPYYYDGRTGKFERRAASAPSARPGVDTAVFYSPRLKKAVYFNHGVWLYDHAANSWKKVNEQGGGDAAYCHDVKRDQVYVVVGPAKNEKGVLAAAGPNVLSVYDIGANQWTKPTTTGDSGTLAMSVTAFLTYDAANDAAVLHVGDRHHVYDPQTRQWTAMPQTIPDKKVNWSASSAFYDPESNAHFYFNALDSSTSPGDMWVYRFKKRD